MTTHSHIFRFVIFVPFAVVCIDDAIDTNRHGLNVIGSSRGSAAITKTFTRAPRVDFIFIFIG